MPQQTLSNQGVDIKWANEVERKQSPTADKGSPTASTPKPPTKRNSSSFSDCGRHSNEWLFRGISVREAAKGLLKRRDS
ncbi:hypothetical protein LTR09_008052 [Extremus antarcticus]|uniref:Uncharacterized protein n=1 Tax=Extremus antarcticus TaxID=702011 RepID=A0AAJ0DBJ8_9PEZI|nr:hypothetical protein LTR09_008052 [Extremus antarcticus]